MTSNQILLFVYLGLIVLMSLIAFCTFCADKNKAKKGAMRIKEKTLLGMSVLNGAIGAFIGRIVAHHKTDKVYFSITIYLSLIAQIGIAILLAILAL